MKRSAGDANLATTARAVRLMTAAQRTSGDDGEARQRQHAERIAASVSASVAGDRSGADVSAAGVLRSPSVVTRVNPLRALLPPRGMTELRSRISHVARPSAHAVQQLPRTSERAAADDRRADERSSLDSDELFVEPPLQDSSSASAASGASAAAAAVSAFPLHPMAPAETSSPLSSRASPSSSSPSHRSPSQSSSSLNRANESALRATHPVAEQAQVSQQGDAGCAGLSGVVVQYDLSGTQVDAGREPDLSRSASGFDDSCPRETLHGIQSHYRLAASLEPCSESPAAGIDSDLPPGVHGVYGLAPVADNSGSTSSRSTTPVFDGGTGVSDGSDDSTSDNEESDNEEHNRSPNSAREARRSVATELTAQDGSRADAFLSGRHARRCTWDGWRYVHVACTCVFSCVQCSVCTVLPPTEYDETLVEVMTKLADHSASVALIEWLLSLLQRRGLLTVGTLYSARKRLMALADVNIRQYAICTICTVFSSASHAARCWMRTDCIL